MLDDALHGAMMWWVQQRSSIWRSPPQYLFHYTSGLALHEILAEHALRGSNYLFVNDRSELAYGQRLLVDAMSDVRRPDMLEHVSHWLASCAKSGHIAPIEPYFVSFCAKSDLLSQWRGYGGAGSRYCISFDTTGFQETERLGSLPQAVIYKEQRQRQILRKIVDHYIGVVSEFGDCWDSESTMKAYASLLSCVLSTTIFFKHPSFAEEQEYRSVVYVMPDAVDQTRFVSVAGVMKPLRLLLQGSSADKRLPITEVIAGTATRDDQAIRSAELMLLAAGYDFVKVAPSRVPLSP
jgi:hypothetical protein